MRKNYVVRAGDTFQSISVRYYKREYFWRFLALVNHQQDIKAGEKIKVPNKYDIAFPISLIITVAIFSILIIRAL